ncbi:DUF4433 domain-containing protein [Acinetobacter seifertii]|uniref:type II toxin-antitoxin system toxin DNA ADP-ribosyl transferase DarT n=1 Tax=Acinetobacter seifertii TaxID=1530123 RepID=UPI0019022C86|nr:DUF4433 domain-containing protein [Acinetobacter seifertii]MBJ8504115.1 DUF4433 domain-containing protein [Acinetobacter seifertii]
MANYSRTLNSEKALIWRIVHIDTISSILDNGLYCRTYPNAPILTSIGNQELIDRRSTHPVPIHPFGCLNDYVPFYFTPFSPMLFNISTGRGVTKRTNEEIVILVSSLHHIQNLGLNFVFSDMHAYFQWANFYNNINDLSKIDWPLLQNRNFSRDQNDPLKFERYQAEALIHQHCPVNALQGMLCYSNEVKASLEKKIITRGINLPVYANPKWYF